MMSLQPLLPESHPGFEQGLSNHLQPNALPSPGIQGCWPEQWEDLK